MNEERLFILRYAAHQLASPLWSPVDLRDALRIPHFGVDDRKRDGRNHVPDNFRDSWDTFSEADRLRA